MSIKRYKFPDEATSMELMAQEGLLVQDTEEDEEGVVTNVGDPHLPHGNKGSGYDVIVLGVQSRKVGEDEDGESIMKTLDGWHVDILTNRSFESLEDYEVYPSTPNHVV